MEEDSIHLKQVNKYDKIVKENMESVLPVFMKDVLRLDISASREIPDDLQLTKERKPDVLKKITDRHNRTFILHIEWQSQNDKNMAYRMAEYAVMLYRKYRLPVKQYVIFMGKDAVTMKTSIKHKNLKFWYKIIPLNGIEYKFFLQSEDPEAKVFAILANFGNDDIETALKNILQGINATADGNLTEEKHINQLRVLVQLCNDNVKLKFKHMISIRTFFKVKDDAFYQIGREEGEAAGEVKGEAKGIVVEKAATAIRLKELGYDTELISKALNIPVSEAEKLLLKPESK
jgi:predicted transposase/invertase (TIGR01784 family)